MQDVSLLDVAGTACFGLAILHTFLVAQFQKIGSRFAEGSVGENFFHLIGEVEVVFGVWAALYLSIVSVVSGGSVAIEYLQSRNFTEPVFVFVIMTICSTKPILELTNRLIEGAAGLLPLKKPVAFFFAALTLGPLLGSLITEPAAMTVTALILWDRYYKKGISARLMYATIGLLFVNVSIGGTLTPYAAPPVLMVAAKWNWDISFMLKNFGWKGALACLASTSIVVYRFRKELANVAWNESKGELASEKSASAAPAMKSPGWVLLAHLVFLGLVVVSAHHLVVFIGLFLFFLGLVTVTKEYHAELKLREGLLVAFFLGGLVVLGGPQRWWLEPILTQLAALPLYLGAMALTAITDNAALTYLGSQVPSLTEASKFALVAGSVVGGGLTVIANAPNPAGYGILNPAFGHDGISPLRLFLNALPPTLIAALCFWFL